MAKCSLKNIRLEVDEHLSDSYKTLALFGVLAVIIAALILYCIYRIIDLILFYKQQKRKYHELRKPKANNALSTTNDDEPKTSTTESVKYDDYTLYTKNIQKTIDEYKSYNEKVKNFYKDYRDGQTPPDIIDASFVDPTKDNY
jgi:hypothetical protein